MRKKHKLLLPGEDSITIGIVCNGKVYSGFARVDLKGDIKVKKIFKFLFKIGNQSDAVNKKEKGYSIRIFVCIGLKSEWQYFELDTTGLIVESPRGMAKEFNKKMRITNMDKMVEIYKDKKLNQR